MGLFTCSPGPFPYGLEPELPPMALLPLPAPTPLLEAPKPAFRLDPDRRLRRSLRLVVVEQVDAAAARLRGHEPDRRHEARKHLKRARAVLQLARGPGVKRLQRELRDIGRELRGVRDLESTREALTRLVDDHPELDGGAASATHAGLRGEHERRTREEGPREDALIARLLLAAERASALDVRGRGRAAVTPGLRKLWAEAFDARDRCQRHGTVQAHHRWRRRVKRLGYAADALAARKKDRRRLDELGELLGQYQDLTLLEAWLLEHPVEPEAEHRGLLAVSLEHRASLSNHAQALADEIFAAKPRRAADRLLDRARLAWS